MVTLITEKLQDQTLEEISTTDTILGEQPRKSAKDRPNIDAIRRTSRLQHRRTLTNRTIKTSDACIQDGSKLGEIASSFLTTRCHSYPPAKKRLCRSLSDPYKEYEGKASWSPEPSSIWTPVKPKRTDRTKPSGARSLEFGSKETFTWATPPESPIPRPVSANSILEDSKFFPLRFISEEKDGSQWEGVVNIGENSNNLSPTMPRRSHSHPSFSHIPNSGLKRRLSEIDIPRPALDFDKMKARSFPDKNVDKRSLKSPKYSSKRHASLSPKNISTSKQEKAMLTPTVPEDLGLSLLITPTASPTADVKTFEYSRVGPKNLKDENANRKSTSLTDCNFITTERIMVDTELDIKLIEEDGTLNNSTYSTMFFT